MFDRQENTEFLVDYSMFRHCVLVCHFSAVIYFFSVDNDILLHWKSAINPFMEFIEDLKQLLPFLLYFRAGQNVSISGQTVLV